MGRMTWWQRAGCLSLLTVCLAFPCAGALIRVDGGTTPKNIESDLRALLPPADPRSLALLGDGGTKDSSSDDDDGPAWVGHVNTATNEVLAALYFLLGLYGVLCLRLNTHPKTRMIKMFCSVLIVGSAFRTAYLAIPAKTMKQTYLPSDYDRFSLSWRLNLVDFVLFSVGNVCFYGLYILIVFFWIRAYYTTRPREVRRSPYQYFFVLLVLYAILQVALVGLFFAVKYKTILTIHSVALALLSALLAAGFLTFWSKLSKALMPLNTEYVVMGQSDDGTPEVQDPLQYQERRNKMRKITYVAVLGSVCAALRCLGQVFQFSILLQKHPKFPSTWWWAIVFVYYLLGEVLTSAAILYILRRRQDNQKMTPLLQPSPGNDLFVTSPYDSGMESVYTSTYDNGTPMVPDDGERSISGFETPTRPRGVDPWESRFFTP